MFNGKGAGYSLSDIAAVTGTNRSNGGFGDGDGAWWILILFLLAGLTLKLQLQYFVHLRQRTDSLEKILMLRRNEGQRRRG